MQPPDAGQLTVSATFNGGRVPAASDATLLYPADQDRQSRAPE